MTMAVISEDYVSFETAKMLKKKGFEGYSILTIYDENAADAYIKELQEKHLPYNSDDPKLKEFYYTIPTLQMAMKWLREVHKLHIDVHLSFSEDPENYPPSYYVYLLNSKSGNSILEKAKTIDKLNPLMDINKNNTPIRFDSYEEACEAAIKYCLEHLI